MEFGPANAVVRLCAQAISVEERGRREEACELFRRAWSEAADDEERLLVAFHLDRLQSGHDDRLLWIDTALQLALRLEPAWVAPARPFLATRLARHHETRGDVDAARRYYELAASLPDTPADPGPYFHGTRAALGIGDQLTAGHRSNYDAGLVMNHVYFTAKLEGVGLAAALASGDGPERVLVVEPTGPFEDDPNVTNKRFPGNPTRSYRSAAPLRITAELSEWTRPADGVVQAWRARLAEGAGRIIN